MQDPAAEDEVEALGESVEFQGVELAVPDFRVEQGVDRPETLPSLELDVPAGADPLDVLLVVDGDHLLCPPGLGEEGVEPVEAADVENGETLEALRDRRKPVAMVARMSRRVDPLPPIERKGVKPVQNVVENPAGLRGIRLDRQQVRHLPLG